jgi:hypothetical protein
MPRSVRPWATASIAIVGTSAIALAPMEFPDTALPADVQVTNTAVQLNATPTPFEYYPQMLKRSLGNAGDRIAEYLADPLPIVRAIAENQNHAFAEVAAAAADLDPVAFARAVIVAIAQPIVNVARVFGTGQPFEAAAGMPLRVALPFVSGLIAAGSSVADAVHALLRLDVTGAASTLANSPGRVADGVLNGRVDGVSGDFFGLLSPVEEAPVSDRLTGPVSFLIHSLQEMGDAIAPHAPMTALADPAAAPDLAAPTVTVHAAVPSVKHAAAQGRTSTSPAPAENPAPAEATTTAAPTPSDDAPAAATTVPDRPEKADAPETDAAPTHDTIHEVSRDTDDAATSSGAVSAHRTRTGSSGRFGSTGAGTTPGSDSNTGKDTSSDPSEG